MDADDKDLSTSDKDETINENNVVLSDNDMDTSNNQAEVKTEGQTKKKKTKIKKKEKETGVIYLSRIPTSMTVKTVRQVLSSHGEIGRIFLQPDEKVTKKKKNRQFSEGWVEFLDKRIAKKVAAILNRNQIGGKRRSPWYEELWSMRYLHRFKWEHLNERLAYERAVHQQRLRTEIAQVKRETNFYIQNVERNERMKTLEKKGKRVPPEVDNDRDWTFKQKETEDEVLSKKSKLSNTIDKAGAKQKKKETVKPCMNQAFLQSIFSGGLVNKDDS